ncbi:MAG: hypothetical protein ACK56F_02040, partial [bacterium]
ARPMTRRDKHVRFSPLARYNFQIWPRVAATVASWESRGQKIGGIMRGSGSSRPNYLIQNIQMMV